jgi:hypothetical protein
MEGLGGCHIKYDVKSERNLLFGVRLCQGGTGAIGHLGSGAIRISIIEAESSTGPTPRRISA